MRSLIVGQWSQLQEKDEQLGAAIDTYFDDGTKTGELFIADAQGNKKQISIKYKWRIADGLLIEEIVSIDKRGIKMPKEYKAIKKGVRYYAKVIKLDEDVLVVKPRNIAGFTENITFYRHDKNTH